MIEEQKNYIPVKNTCWETYYFRIPYTHTQKTLDTCCIYSSYKKPSNDHCNQCFSEISLCFCPCALTLDIVCCIPMIFGCYNVTFPRI